MTLIAYDKPVSDFIARLNATKHVTHKTYKKTSVTLHHNAGRLSHEGVLKVWEIRPASAHFDADGVGGIAQYVNVNEYAWAAGNTVGNMTSIHIEMANCALAPSWAVAEATWKSAARLTGWLFAKVIGERPSSDNFFMHSHWSSTACAGPYIKSIWSLILTAAQNAYDSFKGQKVHPPTPTPKPTSIPVSNRPPQIAVDGVFGQGTKKRLQLWAGVSQDGNLGPISWRAIQSKVGASQDGDPGPNTWRAIQRMIGSPADGVPGPNTYRALQYFLNRH